MRKEAGAGGKGDSDGDGSISFRSSHMCCENIYMRGKRHKERMAWRCHSHSYQWDIFHALHKIRLSMSIVTARCSCIMLSDVKFVGPSLLFLHLPQSVQLVCLNILILTVMQYDWYLWIHQNRKLSNTILKIVPFSEVSVFS